jgi:hypothetical protein
MNLRFVFLRRLCGLGRGVALRVWFGPTAVVRAAVTQLQRGRDVATTAAFK